MTPQDIQSLMTNQLALRRIIGNEEISKQDLGIRASNAIAAQIAANARAVTESRNSGKVTFGRPYERNGRMYRDMLLGGSVVQSEDLGKKSVSGTTGGKWFQNPEGTQVRYFTPGEPPPTGWGAVVDPGVASQRDATTEATLSRIDKAKRDAEERLVAYRSAIEDTSNSLETRQIYVDYFNSKSPDMEYVKVPGGIFSKDRFELRLKTQQTPQTQQTQPAPQATQAPQSQQAPQASQPTQAVQAPQPTQALQQPQVVQAPQVPQYTALNPATPITQEEFEALPVGAIFKDPDDGKLYRK